MLRGQTANPILKYEFFQKIGSSENLKEMKVQRNSGTHLH